jgi:hypothetical protein
VSWVAVIVRRTPRCQRQAGIRPHPAPQHRFWSRYRRGFRCRFSARGRYACRIHYAFHAHCAESARGCVVLCPVRPRRSAAAGGGPGIANLRQRDPAMRRRPQRHRTHRTRHYARPPASPDAHAGWSLPTHRDSRPPRAPRPDMRPAHHRYGTARSRHPPARWVPGRRLPDRRLDTLLGHARSSLRRVRGTLAKDVDRGVRLRPRAGVHTGPGHAPTSPVGCSMASRRMEEQQSRRAATYASRRSRR